MSTAAAEPAVNINPRIEPLLQPISAESPAGESLRYSGVYDSIKDARTGDDQLPQGAWQRPEKRADWKAVERIATGALQSKSKDLQIAVWLGEAWLHTAHLNGLIDGVQLITALHQRFLLHMFPVATPGEQLDRNTIEHRANLIHFFSDRAALALRFVPLTAPDEAELSAHSLADFEKAQYDDQVRRRMELEPPEIPPLEIFDRNKQSTPGPWFLQLDLQLSEAEDSTRALDAVLDEAYGTENGGLQAIMTALRAMRLHIAPQVAAAHTKHPGDANPTGAEFFSETARPESENLAYDTLAPQQSIESHPESMAAPTLAPYSELHASRDIQGRQDAYDRLRDIADYLAKIEPHSPVPFLLRRAIRWGSMRFSDLLPEMMSNQEGLAEVNQILRIDDDR